MNDADIKNISINEIMQKIEKKIEVENKSSNNNENNIRIEFQNREIPFVKKELYTYDDFTIYHDKEFIVNVFRGILKREVDNNGLHHYLTLLRTGQKSKTEIISILRYSKEGKQNSVKLLGSKKRYLIAALYSLPFIGYVSKSFVVLFTLPRLLKRLNSYENYVSQELNIIYEHDKLLKDAINNNTTQSGQKR